jgi:hypothetical protein
MVVNSLKLPASFVQALQEGKLRRKQGIRPLKQDLDAYGFELETELHIVFEDAEAIGEATKSLPRDFQPDGDYGGPGEWESSPGFVPDILDFAPIVCFGMSADGAPFCFDFRQDVHNPSIIWWEDAYWRRIAPNFEAFLDLFDVSGPEAAVQQANSDPRGLTEHTPPPSAASNPAAPN